MLDYILGEMGEFGVGVLQDVALALGGGGGMFCAKNLDPPLLSYIGGSYGYVFP